MQQPRHSRKPRRETLGGRGRTAGFFDVYPQFRGRIGCYSVDHLNFRHARIIQWNKPLLVGARVLDLACYNGRWTLAALKAGASYVWAVDENPTYVRLARRLLADTGLDPATYRVTAGDVYRFLPFIPPGSIDVIFVLGFLYHFGHHVWFFEQLKRIAAKTVILDTRIARVRGEWVNYQVEGPTLSVLQPRIRGYPSPGFLRMAFKYAGYNILRCPLQSTAENAYQAGHRVTIRATRIP